MTDNIRRIFEQNIRLLGAMDKAVLFFRKQQYDKALSLVADSINDIRLTVEGIITDREYFNLVSTDSVLKMLSSILEAQKSNDFILLADLLELQLINFLCGVQELIIGKEEIEFIEGNYQENIRLLQEKGTGFTELLSEPINTELLLENGYRVEFTSCGLMTLAAENAGSKYYFHTNNRILSEAYLLAEQWYREDIKTYIVYGFGMGYPIRELHSLAKDAVIEVYEADFNVIQLACAFTRIGELFEDGRVKLIYDPDFSSLKDKLDQPAANAMVYVHHPSYQNIRSEEGKKLLERFVPWSKTLELG